MTTINNALPDTPKAFVAEQVSQRGDGTSRECVRALIRKDQNGQHLRELLLKGASSNPASPADNAYFESLRDRIRSGWKPELQGQMPGT